MLKDSRSYEVQIIDAVRSVNKALGGTYGTSSAIYKSEFNQYEVQLIDAIKGIGRTLSGKGLSLAGGAGAGDLSGYATIAQFQDLSRRVSILEDESFFRLVDGNITLKPQYQNLWVPGWLAAGGVGSGSGGGSVDHLSDIGDVEIDPDTLANGQGIVWDSTLGVWKNANVGGGGGSGSVTSVNVTVPTGLIVNGVPITSSGTIAISYASGYKIPTTSKQNAWDAKQDAISDLSTIRTNAGHGQTAYGWGDHSQAGYLTSETDPTVPAWAKAQTPSLYVGTTQVQTSSNPQDLTGILSIKASSASASKIEWNSSQNAWHFYGNVYADGWVSAGGIGSSGGGGGSTVEISNLLSSGTRIATITVDGTDYDILAPNNSGTVTSVKLGSTSYNPVNGVVSLPAYPTTLPASDVYSWAKASSKPSYSLSEISGTDDLQAIEALSGTSGLLKKTGSNTWSLDTTNYLSSHQTIYKLTLNAGTFTAGEYTPNSSAKTFNIPTTLDHVADGTNRKLSDYVTLGTTQTITGAKTFSTNPVTIASSSGLSVHASSYIDIGDARLVYDSGSKALHVTMKSGSSNIIGFFADGFVSAGGVGGQSTAFVDLESNQTIGGNKTFTGITTLGDGISFSSDEINYSSRLYIQYNSNDLCLTKNGKTIIGTYPGSGAVGSNKLYVDGSAIATSWNTSSDARLKDDIAYLSKSDAVEKLMGLKPASWKWNSGPAKGHTATGFIAQEVEPVLPFMVTGEDYKGLAYQMLHAYEVSAIQSHEARIKFLERENEALRKEIERLKS